MPPGAIDGYAVGEDVDLVFFAPADIASVGKAIHDDFARGIDGDLRGLRLIEKVDAVDRFDDDARFADFKFISFAWRRKNNEKGRAKAGCPSSTHDRFAKRNLAVSPKKLYFECAKV